MENRRVPAFFRKLLPGGTGGGASRPVHRIFG